MADGGIAEVSLVLAAVGTAASVAGAIQQGNAASSAAEYNARVAAQNAVAVRQQAEQEARLQTRRSQQQIGAARAAYGAAGVTSDGSPLDVLASSASNAELDRQTILYKGNLQAAGYLDENALDLARAGTATQQGFLTAGGALFKGGASIADKLAKPTAKEGTPVTPNPGSGDPND